MRTPKVDELLHRTERRVVDQCECVVAHLYQAVAIDSKRGALESERAQLFHPILRKFGDALSTEDGQTRLLLVLRLAKPEEPKSILTVGIDCRRHHLGSSSKAVERRIPKLFISLELGLHSGRDGGQCHVLNPGDIFL